MISVTSSFQHPLQGRYASKEMKALFSDDMKFSTWRKFWLAQSECYRDLGQPITLEQIQEMQANIYNIDYEFAQAEEKRTRHDVVAHINAFAKVCPTAKPIIHLGDTSMEPVDNTDLSIQKKALWIIEDKIARVIHRLANLANRWKNLVTLGWTHLKEAQLTTVGKRICMWIFDLLTDLKNVKRFNSEMNFRGMKGASGTQDSFLKVLKGDHEKVKKLDSMMAEKFDFSHVFPITGQNYSRKQDTDLIAVLASLGATICKITNDIRFLVHEKEMDEPYEPDQVGSSAMAYKRNPMRSERAGSLGMYLSSLFAPMCQTFGSQFLERTLNDSAIRRLIIPEAFLTADAILLIMQNIAEGLIIYPKVIAKHIARELPFMATEEIIIRLVEKGEDRQAAHARLKKLSQMAGDRIKLEGAEDNNLIDLIKTDPFFAPIHRELNQLLDPSSFIGRAPEQVEEFLTEDVFPALKMAGYDLEVKSELNV